MFISPSKELRSELLPAPVGPTTTHSSPLSISRFMKEIVSLDMFTLVLYVRISLTLSLCTLVDYLLIAYTSNDDTSDESSELEGVSSAF